MATIVTKTIKPGGGGDYTSLAAWNAGEARNLVALDEAAVAECYAGIDGGGVLDINGWVTGPTNTITIKAAGTGRHAGKFDATKYVFPLINDMMGITLRQGYVHIDGLQLKANPASNNCYCIAPYQATGWAKVSNCIIIGNRKAGHGVLRDYSSHPSGQHNIAGPFHVWNNVIADIGVGSWGEGHCGIVFLYGTDWQIHNNTIHRCSVGIGNNCNTSMTANNNVITAAVYRPTYLLTGYNNVSDGMMTEGANSKSYQTPAFTDAANYDFHLLPTDTACRGAGVNMSANASLPFNTDSEGQERIAPWDVGADQFVQIQLVEIIRVLNPKKIIGSPIIRGV